MDGATEVLAQLVVHGVLATLVVETLVHWLPVDAPSARFAYRTAALALPLLLAGAFAVAAPFRSEDWFRDASVFVSARWTRLRVGPTDVRTLGLAAAGVLGALLLSRDLAGTAVDAWGVWRDERRVPRVPVPPTVDGIVGDLARSLDIPPPAVDVLVSEHHALHCRGWIRPRIVMSTGTLAALAEPSLRSALAHELAHVAHHDVPRGWALLLLRALQWFNPVAQALGRRAAQELEWYADDRAASMTGAPLALAQALIRCARHRGDQFLGLSGHGRLRHLEERCRRLMHGAVPHEPPSGLEIALLSTGLTALLIFVQ